MGVWFFIWVFDNRLNDYYSLRNRVLEIKWIHLLNLFSLQLTWVLEQHKQFYSEIHILWRIYDKYNWF